jgi:SAM-dependent methyltransferase
MTLIYDHDSSLLPYRRQVDEIPAQAGFEFLDYPCFCDSRDAKPVSNTTRHRTKLDVVQCQCCGALRINPYLSDASIARYYAEYYRDLKHDERTPETTFEAQKQHSGDAFRFIRPHLTPSMKILDYGCASGGRMAPFLDAGYDVSGFDLDEDFVAYAESRGVRRYVKAEKYDLIFLSHVVEHINDPVATLQDIAARNLAEGGFIYITVPLIDRQGGPGRHKDLLSEIHLAHKFYFTQPSLLLLAALAGFAPVAEDWENFLFGANPAMLANRDDPVLMEVSNDVLRRARRQLRSWRFGWYVNAIKQTTRRRLGLSGSK